MDALIELFRHLTQTCVMEIDGQQFIWLRLLIIDGHDFYGCGHATEVLNLWSN